MNKNKWRTSIAPTRYSERMDIKIVKAANQPMEVQKPSKISSESKGPTLSPASWKT